MKLNSFTYFRGIAIILIVAGHLIGISGWNVDTTPEYIINNLIAGGTSLFVFISGFLFHHVFYKRFEYKTFMKKKIRNVLIPYLLLSIPGIIFRFYIGFEIFGNEYSFHNEGVTNIFTNYISPSLLLYYTGKTYLAYWYIGFIMIVFALSPIFIAYINKLNTTKQIIIFISFSILSMIIHRPIGNLNQLHSVVYYMPVYMLGIICSLNKEKIYSALKGKEYLFLFGAIFFSWLQVVLHDEFGNYHKNFLSITVLDLMFPQKIMLNIFFMVFLHRFENKEFPVLENVANASFSIFFLHPILIEFLKRLPSFNVLNLSGSIYLLLITSIVVITSYIIALLTKRIFRKNSRLIVGW